MPPSPYDNCPCGSGKKFKWCCTGYWEQIERALDLYQQGQLENALRVMDQLAKDHPDKPQVWGYYAHILFREEKMEEAEAKLQKAFDLNPNFPMGHLLRGLFRQSEGEVIGALLLYRKAAEAYPPEAHDQLSQVYEMIARNELVLNRPLACRVALERAVHFSPGDQEIREQYEGMFGPDARMPECVKKRYTFRPTAAPAPTSESGRFSEAKAGFERMTREVPTDPAAWFNLGLVLAWTGEQGPAIEALNKSVELEYDDAKAEEAAALVEVLRCGQGLEKDGDYAEHRYYFEIRDPQAMVQLLQTWGQEGRMMAPQSDESGQMFSCILVEPLPSLVETGTTMAKVVANVQIVGRMMRVWHGERENAQKVAVEVRDRVNMAVGEPTEQTGPAQLGEITQSAYAYPMQIGDVAQAQQKMQDYAANYFEITWAHKPLRALGGATPIDAAGSKLMRKRLLGVIQFLADCTVASMPRMAKGGQVVQFELYDFNRLRHKLGVEKQAAGDTPPELLAAAKAATANPGGRAAGVSPTKKDFGAMSAADLAALKTDELSCVELEDAMKAALKLDARELAVSFAKAGVARPADPAKPDRYPLYLALISAASSEGNHKDALAAAEAGLAYDAGHNGGRRANEFGLRAAQLQAKTGNADAAAAAFDKLIERNPDEGRYYIAAVETMLSAKQAAKALAFAEKGLETATRTGNRDLEGACTELREAAKKMMK
jgi:tetratricopeptide (TPR) repeat protein